MPRGQRGEKVQVCIVAHTIMNGYTIMGQSNQSYPVYAMGYVVGDHNGNKKWKCYMSLEGKGDLATDT